MSKNDSPRHKNHKKPLVITGVALAFLVITIIGFAIPIAQPEFPDKLYNKSTATEQNAANMTLESQELKTAYPKVFPRVQVVKVEPTPGDNHCSDSNSFESYTVTTRDIGFFGIILRTQTDTSCAGRE